MIVSRTLSAAYVSLQQVVFSQNALDWEFGLLSIA